MPPRNVVVAACCLLAIATTAVTTAAPAVEFAYDAVNGSLSISFDGLTIVEAAEPAVYSLTWLNGSAVQPPWDWFHAVNK